MALASSPTSCARASHRAAAPENVNAIRRPRSAKTAPSIAPTSGRGPLVARLRPIRRPSSGGRAGPRTDTRREAIRGVRTASVPSRRRESPGNAPTGSRSIRCGVLSGAAPRVARVPEQVLLDHARPELLRDMVERHGRVHREDRSRHRHLAGGLRSRCPVCASQSCSHRRRVETRVLTILRPANSNVSTRACAELGEPRLQHVSGAEGCADPLEPRSIRDAAAAVAGEELGVLSGQPLVGEPVQRLQHRNGPDGRRRLRERGGERVRRRWGSAPGSRPARRRQGSPPARTPGRRCRATGTAART